MAGGASVMAADSDKDYPSSDKTHATLPPAIKHMTFHTDPSLLLRDVTEVCEQTRRRAEGFINTVGAGNVVSVTESFSRFLWTFRFSVSVWYREGQGDTQD